MKVAWQEAFSRHAEHMAREVRAAEGGLRIDSIEELRKHLDVVHIRQCLLKPFNEISSYPFVEKRELLPSFEADTWEHPGLPGFSLVALARPLQYFQEIFQFDILHPPVTRVDMGGLCCPLDDPVAERNVRALRQRLPRHMHEEFLERFAGEDVTALEGYAGVLPYLLQLDRAHVLAHDGFGHFHLAGAYASFPSDLDTEIKRFGMRIGKFAVGDNERYERNRYFVYQFLMELYGFPIVSERRTSSALFARRLHKLREPFMIRVLGQSDRTITTMYTHQRKSRQYPVVEKIALVQLDKAQKELLRWLRDGGWLVDTRKRVVILRVRYRQHSFNPNNVYQDRALSVASQQLIHPITGETSTQWNIIKDTTNMVLRLNDIVRGEFVGRVVYKRHELVENTDTDEKRLKFLYAWLSKHQRRIIGYSDEFYANVVKVLDTYLLGPDNYESFQSMHDLYQEVWAKYSYIQQARKLNTLDRLRDRWHKGERISYLDSLRLATELLHEFKFEIVQYFDELVLSVIRTGETMLNDTYLQKTYLDKKDEELTEYGQDVKRWYGRLVALVDEFKAIRRTRADAGSGQMARVV